ncbi:MAG: DUF3853 family protein [Muribaculaceae bacterium]|nr:DUF3853 family protein [Muribaculaceae bacterium]
MEETIKNRPIMMLTVGELMEVLLPAIGFQADNSKSMDEENGKKYVYGVAGLAKLLGCSVSTAQRRISSGKLDKCIIRSGRLIVIDRDAVLQTLKGGKT